MSSFTKPLVISSSDKQGFWKIEEAFDYYIDNIGSEITRITISVPVGFETDFASIPRVLWNILPPFGTYGKAAIVHDFLYSVKSNALGFSRAESDGIFLEAMGVLKTPTMVRYSMWAAVRSFGWMFYKKAVPEQDRSVGISWKIENL